MQEDLSDVKIYSEEKFMELVNQLNADIAFNNSTKPKKRKEPLLDMEYLLKRYRSIKGREVRKAFKELYDCEYCFYFEKPRKCYASERCPLEMGKGLKKKETVRLPTCPKDKEGNCPYGNDVGTCFGFCLQEILSEFHKNKNEAGTRNCGK